jgi:peptidoglycan/LPS O-acetylase OafA/YrhL
MIYRGNIVHFEGLNLLRFVSASMIVVVHATSGYKNLPLHLLIHNLNLGVDFFFIISGFLITYLYWLRSPPLKGSTSFLLCAANAADIPALLPDRTISFITFIGHTNLHIDYFPHLFFWGNFEVIRIKNGLAASFFPCGHCASRSISTG